jgi:hypothetical protein
MMVEIESLDGDKQLISIDGIRRVVKSEKEVSDVDDEPLAVIHVAGVSEDIILKHSFDAFRRVLEGGGVRFIRG